MAKNIIISEALHSKLKKMALDEKITLQQLTERLLNKIFEKK